MSVNEADFLISRCFAATTDGGPERSSKVSPPKLSIPVRPEDKPGPRFDLGRCIDVSRATGAFAFGAALVDFSVGCDSSAVMFAAKLSCDPPET